MAEKYEPWLIGVHHKKEYAEEIIERILALHVKSVGLEMSWWRFGGYFYSKSYLDSLSHYQQSSRTSMLFFKKIIDALTARDIKIVYLISNQLDYRVSRKSMAAIFGILFSKILGKGTILAVDTKTRFMEKKAIKERPEAIITGMGHADLMRKDMKIPKEKCINIPLVTKRERFYLKFIREIRRLQIRRRKTRKKRLEEIKKRKQKPK